LGFAPELKNDGVEVIGLKMFRNIACFVAGKPALKLERGDVLEKTSKKIALDRNGEFVFRPN